LKVGWSGELPDDDEVVEMEEPALFKKVASLEGNLKAKATKGVGKRAIETNDDTVAPWSVASSCWSAKDHHHGPRLRAHLGHPPFLHHVDLQ
jgi:hypothetical protein